MKAFCAYINSWTKCPTLLWVLFPLVPGVLRLEHWKTSYGLKGWSRIESVLGSSSLSKTLVYPHNTLQLVLRTAGRAQTQMIKGQPQNCPTSRHRDKVSLNVICLCDYEGNKTQANTLTVKGTVQVCQLETRVKILLSTTTDKTKGTLSCLWV